MQPQEIPQNVEGKASRFPYWVMLCVMAPNIAYAIIPIIEYGPHILHALRFLLTYTSYLVIAAVYGFGGTQWMLERRRTAGLPVYAAVCIGILSVLISKVWGFLDRFLFKSIVSMMMGTIDEPSYTETLEIEKISNALLLPHYVMQALITLFSIWLVFRLLRGRERPEIGAMNLRGRAILISGLFAWAWTVAAQSTVLSMARGVFGGGLLEAVADADAQQISAFFGGYLIGCAFFTLPALLGIVFGLPANMPAARVGRLWITSTLAMLINAAVWYAVFNFALHINDKLLDFYKVNFSSLWWLALVILLWQVSATLLCRLIVRALMRLR